MLMPTDVCLNQVKEAMVDSANASVAALKRDLGDAQMHAEEAGRAAADAESQLADRDQEEAERLRDLR